MLMSKFLSRLATGALGDLAVGGGGTGDLPPESAARIVEFAQDALTELYRRFPLSLKTITLAVMDGRFEYPLEEKYAVTSPIDPSGDKFIIDSMSKPFDGRVLAIEHVSDSTGAELPLNERYDAASWFTPESYVLNMGYPVAGDLYFVEYRANHPILDPEPETFDTQVIKLPEALEVLFLNRVSYALYATQSGENAAIKAQELEGAYNAKCAEIEAANTLNSSQVQNRSDVIERGGWA